MDKNTFIQLLREAVSDFGRTISDERGNWAVKGFIDTYRKIYTISCDTKVISKIIELMLNEVKNRMKAQKYEIEFSPKVKELIAKKGIDKAFGARPLKRTIQNLVEDKIAEAILDGVVKKGKEASVDCDGDEVVIK